MLLTSQTNDCTRPSHLHTQTDTHTHARIVVPPRNIRAQSKRITRITVNEGPGKQY